MIAAIEFSPFIIPIVAIVMGIGVAMLAIVTDYGKRKHLLTLQHQERMAAIDKGMELPPLTEDGKDGSPSPRRNLLKGLVWLFIGGGLLFALPKVDDEVSRLGLIPLGIGAAYLIYYFAVGRKEADLADEERRAKLAETNRASRG